MVQSAGDVQRTYGHYEVESVLGRGAMGMVYLARDRRIGRKVALKTVHVEERFDDESEANEFYKRLQREAELGGALQHPNIVTLYEPGYENNVIAWLATEYVDGESLRDRLKKRKPLPVAEAVRLSSDILRGLSFAHKKGIIHRDIKPANIMLTSRGEAKIADFGIARPSDSNLTAVGEMLGTPSYMSPEQVKCIAVTSRSDLFSLGAVMYELLTGVKAFAANDVSGILKNVVDLEPRTLSSVNAGVPEVLSAFVLRLLAKKPEERWASADASLAELERITAELGLAEEPVEEVPPSAAVMPDAQKAASASPFNETHPSVTNVGHDDRTPAMGTRSQPAERTGFDRPLPLPIAIGVVVLLLGGLTAAAIAIRLETDSTPTWVHPPEQLREFAQKRASLSKARVLFAAGEHEAAVRAYNTYIDRYPNSLAAMEGRDAAYAALDVKEKAKVTVTAKKASRFKKMPQKPPEPAKKPWFRRIFNND